ncbi:MAG: GerMN domain-containing protein [Fusobacteriaceae bacterium]
MRKGIMVILTALFTGSAFYSGMTYFLLEQESREIREIIIESKNGGSLEIPKVKRNLYVPSGNFSSLERVEIESVVEADRGKLVKMIYSQFFEKVKEGQEDFSQPELLNIYWADRDLYLNLGKSESLTRDQNGALIILYGITNSVTEMGGVNRIKFLIEGKEMGGVFSTYYERNLKI